MKVARRQKLLIILSLMALAALVLGLVMYALRQNIALFYTPAQVSTNEVPMQQLVRMGGMVVKGSVERAEDSTHVRFRITDYHNTLTIEYAGILPDLFREGQGIVAEGRLIDRTHFQATEVLAKHDERYMPPQLRDVLTQDAG